MYLTRTDFNLELFQYRLDSAGIHSTCGRNELEQFCQKLDEVMQIVFNNLDSNIENEIDNKIIATADKIETHLQGHADSIIDLNDRVVPITKIRTIIKAEVTRCFSRMVKKDPGFMRELREM